MVSIPLVNGGPSVVQVQAVQLVAPQFAPVAPTAARDDLAVGQRVDFPVPYGVVRCGPVAAPGEVVVALREADGRRQTLRLRLREHGVLQRLQRAECRQQELASALAVEWASTWTQVPARDGGAARLAGELRLEADGRTRVTVTELRGSVLFDLLPGSPTRLPVRLDEDARTVTLKVEIGVARCDRHALAEAKRIFEFSLYLQLGDAPAEHRTITPPQAVQNRALALLRTCPQG